MVYEAENWESARRCRTITIAKHYSVQ